MIDKKDITGIVLAGGKSSRMGTDKGFLMFDDKPFIQHSIDALKPLVSEIIIVSDNNNYDVFGYKRVEDLIKNSGPVAGIYSGLKASKTIYNLILSCDIPLINSELLKTILKEIDEKSEIIQVESNNKTMPLITLYKTSCKTKFSKLLQQGEKRLQFAVNQCEVKTITLNKHYEISTSNVNSKEEFKRLKNEYHH